MFYQPKDIQEALGLKAKLKERGTFIAGGTDIVVLMNHGKAAPENFIDLTHIPELRAIHRHNGTIELAGNVTYAQCGRLPIRCLAQASLSVGGPGIRELGTSRAISRPPRLRGTVPRRCSHSIRKSK